MTTAGGLYRYNISDLVRCVGYHGQAPMLEFLNKGAHYSSLTGEKISEHQVVAAVEAAQRTARLRVKSYLLAPVWDDPPYYALLVEEDDLSEPAAVRNAWRVPSKRELRRQNVEYVCKRDSLRLGPVRILPIPNGSWAEFQRRRLVRSGGTVEQYKQPHLVPDLNIAETLSSPGTGELGPALADIALDRREAVPLARDGDCGIALHAISLSAHGMDALLVG